MSLEDGQQKKQVPILGRPPKKEEKKGGSPKQLSKLNNS